MLCTVHNAQYRKDFDIVKLKAIDNQIYGSNSCTSFHTIKESTHNEK